MRKWWKIVQRILVWGGLAALVGMGVMTTKQSLSYSSLCTSCLATRSGVERSILGIPYENKQKPIRYLYDTAEAPRLAKFSEGRQTIYQQIHEKSCDHHFVRTGFCRYRAGSIGCGGFGGSSEVRSRNELVSGAFRAFERVADKQLAVRSCQLIEREFPLVRPPRTGGQNLVEESAERLEQYRRMILLGELLDLVRHKEVIVLNSWRWHWKRSITGHLMLEPRPSKDCFGGLIRFSKIKIVIPMKCGSKSKRSMFPLPNCGSQS